MKAPDWQHKDNSFIPVKNEVDAKMKQYDATKQI